jgi:hypothetical protein
LEVPLPIICFRPAPPEETHPASDVYVGPDCATWEYGRGFVICRGRPTEADVQDFGLHRRPARVRQVRVLGVLL